MDPETIDRDDQAEEATTIEYRATTALDITLSMVRGATLLGVVYLFCKMFEAIALAQYGGIG